MNFGIGNPQFAVGLSASLNPVAGIGLSGGLNLNAQMNAPAGVGIGAGNIDGIALGQIIIPTGSPLTIDCSNLAGTAALTLYQNAATAAFLVAMAIQITALNAGDSAAETLTIGGGSNPILVASAGILCLTETYAWQKIKSGGLTIGGGNKNILLTASAGTMTANIILWTRSA